MEDLLEKLAEGKISVSEAKEELDRRLHGSNDANIDTGRMHRTGVPEVILAEGKSDGQIKSIMDDFLDRTGRAIVSRLEEGRADTIMEHILGRSEDLIVKYEPLSSFMVAHLKSMNVNRTGGKVGIITAGTSDIAVAKEAELMVNEMGCDTKTFYDVGVAGIHRIVSPMRELEEWKADVIIVAAGREGALPTLVSGMTRTPVIGLPISTGYGIHGKGETALFAMLQSCSPIAVVNIDAGFVAGSLAGKIANGITLRRE